MLKTLIIGVPLGIAAVVGAVYLVLAETAPKASEVKPAVIETIVLGRSWFSDLGDEVERRLLERAKAEAPARAKQPASESQTRVAGPTALAEYFDRISSNGRPLWKSERVRWDGRTLPGLPPNGVADGRSGLGQPT